MSSISVSVGPHFSTDPISHVLLTGIHYPPRTCKYDVIVIFHFY